MQSRRSFIYQSAVVAAVTTIMPKELFAKAKYDNAGVQLYTFRNDMLANPKETLARIAALGIKQIESAGSDKGYYYGLTGVEMKAICADHGMQLRSGHVHIDDDWEKTMENAAASGQEYLICSSMPTRGQTIDNYKRTAAQFNKAAEACKKYNLKFGYHNHDYEFEKVDGVVLYDVLMDNTEASLMHMELDLGWVVASGNDPLFYFKKYPGRFPLWHLKDMDLQKKHSTEFGKGGLDISQVFAHAKQSGLKYFFIEQEEYSADPWTSMQENMAYLKKMA